LSATATRQGWSLETRLCVLVFGVALAINAGLSGIGWNNSLLGSHEFRQTQTALTVDRFLIDGVKLDYETPILGPPWQIPLELPVYQAGVTWFVRATGLPLEQSGRLVSWLFFLSALPACFLLLGRLGVPRPHRLLFLSLLLLSPLYIFFSRGFLIESTALSFACWFLICFARYLDRGHIAWLIGAAICGAAAGMIKVTTFAVFLIAALIFLGRALRIQQKSKLKLWLEAAAAVLIPLSATLWWTAHTAGVRHRNPEASFLDSHFGFWSFGDLAQRVSGEFWLRTFRVWADGIVGEAGVALVVLYYCWIRGRYRWAVTGCLAAFLSGQLIFSNLYWVHDYYFYASGLFLVAALGFFMVEFIARPDIPVIARWIFVAVVLGLQVSAYDRYYRDIQAENTPVPSFVNLIADITDTDDMIITVGYDWNAWVPYYSHRRAFMVLNGREFEIESLRKSIEKLDPAKVAAVIIRGKLWDDAGFVAGAMARLNLDVKPLFVLGEHSMGVWVPRDRQARLRDQFDYRRYPGVAITPDQNSTGGPKTIHEREIARREEFASFEPRPIRATALNDFTQSSVDDLKVLNAHAISEIVFELPSHARRITGSYGIADAAYERAGMSDGVEFVIIQRSPEGVERTLFQRFLNPHAVAADRGRQVLDVPLTPPGTGELFFRTLPGPNNNASYDWCYWGQLKIR
jgi:hypothetical protein